MNNNIIKDTVLKKIEEKNETRTEKQDDIAGWQIVKNGRWYTYDTAGIPLENTTCFTVVYKFTKCSEENIIYEIRLTKDVERQGKDLISYIQAIWQQEEGPNGNIIRFTLLHGTKESPNDRFKRHTIINLERKSMDLMIPANKEMITQGFENEEKATFFVDAWNRAVADAKLEHLYSRLAKVCENTLKGYERKQDPEWQTICEVTNQLRTTQAGKETARKLIQGYLQREKQNTK